MSIAGTAADERVYRPELWRYVIFRFVVITVAFLVAFGAVRLMEAHVAIPHLRGLDLAIVGAIYLLLDTFYAALDRNRFALRLSTRAISVARGPLGQVTIPWSQFDWQATRRRGIFDQLLGQTYICGTAGQRILWQYVVHPPADVRAILAELARHGEAGATPGALP